MAAVELEGETLGQKHKDYNTKLQELITTCTSPASKIGDDDINTLLKIDVASHNKDVEYILEMLKSDDMLYVSRALSQSTWLITDQAYANIINPDYIKTNLYPNMTIKAALKLKKHIRHNIKDETRAEQFYLSETNITDALKWLPYCSVKFIEIKIRDYMQSSNRAIPLRLFRRLCEKSTTIFDIVLKELDHYQKGEYLKTVAFILKVDPDKYLDIIENSQSDIWYTTRLSHKTTEIIMKHSTKRVIDKIEKYASILHIPTFAKYLTPDQIKNMVITIARKDLSQYSYWDLKNLFYVDKLKFLIRRLPKNEQFDFVKNLLSTETEEVTEEEILDSDTDDVRVMKLCNAVNSKPYVWYELASFQIAFEKITKLYLLSEDDSHKHEMLSILIKCADYNLQHIQDIITFYNKHTKENSEGKCRLVTKILEHTHISKYDEKTWNMLNELLISAKVYEKDGSDGWTEQIINSIIIYNVLNGHKTPEIIENEFLFDTLESYKSEMNQEQQDKLFGYLYDYLLSKIKKPVTEENQLKESIVELENVLKLLTCWDKSFLDFPLILNKIKELITLKKKNSWKTNLSSLYNVNKSWRKYMFEESVALYPSEDMCLNALKHEPQLLARHADETDDIRSSGSITLHRMHRKLRLYWPQSLAKQWTDYYMNNLDNTNGQKAAVLGICVMLAQQPLLDVIDKYKPVNPKIDWKQIDENYLNVQRLLAKNMHISRPQPTPDAILAYAKGDYLQFALPSLLAIYYNLKPVMDKQYVPKLLDAPVSLQKHGIRHAFKRLDREELRKIFFDCWKICKNVSIRAIIFKYTFKMLCSEKDDANAVNLWELLELFIDNLTFTEDKDTYKLLSAVEKIPQIVRAKFLVKSYEFLRKLIPHVSENNRSTYEWNCACLAEHSAEVMETINLDFVRTVIQEFIEHDFLKGESKFLRSIHNGDSIICVISAYVLCTTSESEQLQRYEEIIVPLMQQSFEKWDEKRGGNFVIRQNFQHLLKRLSLDLKEYVTEKKKVIPVKMFSLIQIELEKTLKISENYMMLTRWKITVALARFAEQYSSVEGEKVWYENCGSEFGKICLEYLKNDVSTHFPCIYVLFAKAVQPIMEDILTTEAKVQFFETLLTDKDFIQSYLSAIELRENNRNDDEYKSINNLIFSHPSVEVKMHYYCKIDKKKI